MRKAFLYLEFLMALGLLAILSLFIITWQKNFSQITREYTNFFRQRENLLNAAESSEGKIMEVSANYQLREVQAGKLKLKYLSF